VGWISNQPFFRRQASRATMQLTAITTEGFTNAIINGTR
jgi:hypothetical protein